MIGDFRKHINLIQGEFVLCKDVGGRVGGGSGWTGRERFRFPTSVRFSIPSHLFLVARRVLSEARGTFREAV